ncbi:MAG: RDD family protein [Nanoarchaeota archaeon]|nr:RDD family protein [Nanoarchaeota archaeon]MBU1135146.1 RDD family protein [Nanoarchaeota archaeon]MBU2519729.1 RDD family protein [Nanoarchaeota archaeon]
MANYAGVGSRFIALLVDGIILGIIMLLIALPFGATSMMFGMMSPTGISNILGIIAMYSTLMIVWFVISLLYFSYFESKSGQTLGKKLVNIKVVTEKGKNLTFGTALIRTILRIVDGQAGYLLGLIIILISDKKQRLGDMAAKSIVVKA